MCEIHLIYPLKGLITAQDCSFMQHLLSCGAISNKDAWGACSPSLCVAEPGKYNNQALQQFEGQPFIVGHNRLATQGKTAQPIGLNGWLFAHNGIFWNETSVLEKEHSDSYLWLKGFTEYAAKCKNPVKALSKYLHRSTEGSHSFFLVSPEGRLFYSKSSYTKMTFKLLRIDDRLTVVCDTDVNSIKGFFESSLFGFPIRGSKHNISTIEPRSNAIYEFTQARGVQLVATYEPKAYQSTITTVKTSLVTQEDIIAGNIPYGGSRVRAGFSNSDAKLWRKYDRYDYE